MAKSAPPGARVRAARFLPADRPHLVPPFASLSTRADLSPGLGGAPGGKGPFYRLFMRLFGLDKPGEADYVAVDLRLMF